MNREKETKKEGDAATREGIISEGETSSKTYEVLERIVREKVQEFIQDVLEEEVSEFFGQGKSEWKKSVDGVLGYRNGYGKPPRLSSQRGTIKRNPS